MELASYSSDSRAVIKSAKEVAISFKHQEIAVDHLLIAVLRHDGSEVESILNQLGKSIAFVESVAEEHLKEQPGSSPARENISMSPPVQDILANAAEEKGKLYDPLVEPEHIFLAIFDLKSNLSSFVREQLDISHEDIYGAIAENKSIEEIASSAATDAEGVESQREGKAKVSGTLKYCIDMTNQAAAGEFDPMIGREKELQQMIQILLRRRKNSPVLVGGAGVGKSAIVEGFAQSGIDDRLPEALRDTKVMTVDMGSLVAGAKYKGEFEERFKALVSEVVKSAGRIVLFIDEIHTLVGAGNSSGGMDAANLLKPALARGQIRLIGATTEEEYTKYIEKDKALDRRFERIKIEEPDFEDSVRIVKGVIEKYEEHHKIKFMKEAVRSAVKYSRRYLSERNLPDIALDLVDEAASTFSVKEEFGKRYVEEIESGMSDIEKLISSCEGSDPRENPDEYGRLQEAYDEFSRSLDTLYEYWGHRLEND